jgi:hypothetical protein
LIAHDPDAIRGRRISQEPLDSTRAPLVPPGRAAVSPLYWSVSRATQ